MFDATKYQVNKSVIGVHHCMLGYLIAGVAPFHLHCTGPVQVHFQCTSSTRPVQLSHISIDS